jgi:hypothetical protein
VKTCSFLPQAGDFSFPGSATVSVKRVSPPEETTPSSGKRKSELLHFQLCGVE